MAEQAKPLLEDFDHVDPPDIHELVLPAVESATYIYPITEQEEALPESKRSRWQTASSWTVVWGSYLMLALPRYLQPGGFKGPETLHATSYLDALRGYAAWIVVNFHRFDLRDLWIMKLPFVRTINSGKGMVDVFFVISGFVLAQRMLIQIRTQQKTKLMDSFTSSIFRRYLRLYIPSALASFLSMLLLHFGVTAPATPRMDSIFAQTWDWAKDFAAFSNPFANVTGWWYGGVLNSAYLGALWTIPVEFRGSIIVFVFCAGTARLSSKHRLLLCSIAITLSFVWQAIYVSLFLSGVLLAEVSLIRHPERYQAAIALPLNSESEKKAEGQGVARRIGFTCLFLFSIFLLGQPRDMRKGFFPWPYLNPLVPSRWDGGAKAHFWTAIASPLLIFSVDSSPMLQRPFLTKFSQYLGELSFGIYVMHLLVIWSLYMKVLMPFLSAYLGRTTWTLIPAVLINWLVVLWAADYFERVDRRVVKMGRWLQTKYFLAW